jgi:hypothetical protein
MRMADLDGVFWCIDVQLQRCLCIELGLPLWVMVHSCRHHSSLSCVTYQIDKSWRLPVHSLIFRHPAETSLSDRACL